MAAAGPDLVYELFNVFAEWEAPGRGGMPWGRFKLLLRELDVLEGIPATLQGAYVREILGRADQDQDGLLSCEEFMVWLFTEGCALLPFRHNGSPSQPLAPLYNRYNYLCQKSRPVGGASSKANGLSHGSFMQMCQDLGWLADARLQLRNGTQLATHSVVASRTQGKMEAGNKMQFTAFALALQRLAVRKREGWDTIIYKVVGDGSPPPTLFGHGCNTVYRRTVLSAILPALVEGVHEGGLRWTCQACDVCGKEHSVWQGVDPAVRAALHEIGAPHVQYTNARNVRAAFHRYCLRFNKGILPPSTFKPSDDPIAAALGTPSVLQAGADASRDTQGGSRSDQQEGASQQDPWGCAGFSACCCMYKQMGLMELQTFWRVVADNKTLWCALQPRSRNPVLDSPSDTKPKPLYEPLVPGRVEAAFMTACSVAGVYCSDRSLGIHDKPVHSAGGAGEHTQGSTGAGLHRSTSARPYGTPFDANTIRDSTLRASKTSRVPAAALHVSQAGGVATARSSVRDMARSLSANAAASATLAAAAATLDSATAADVAVPPGRWSHRPAVPRLNFPQFLEALRLLAEDCVGHPQVTLRVHSPAIRHACGQRLTGALVSNLQVQSVHRQLDSEHLSVPPLHGAQGLKAVETQLALILHDVAWPGCPLQPHQSLAWTMRPGQMPAHTSSAGSCAVATGITFAKPRPVSPGCRSPHGGSRVWS